MTLPYHPYADLFPLIEGAEFDDLVADIKANGLHEEIVLLDGMILDGRNRYRAAVAAGLFAADVNPRTDWHFVDFSARGGIDSVFSAEVIARGPLAYVISKNLRRRHMNESQRAMAAAALANLGHGERADRRQTAPSDAGAAEVAGTARPANWPVLETAAALPPAPAPISQAEAARLLNVGERSVRRAKLVRDKGAPALKRAVEQGQLAVGLAAQAVGLALETQVRIAAEAAAGGANAVRTVVKREHRDRREAALAAKQRELPAQRYGVIYADPEWRFEPRSRARGLDRAADNHYPTTATVAIAARPVAAIAAADCVLFLWATAPMLPDALAVLQAWGFAYKTHLVWRKRRAGAGRGSGYWFTGEHELLLVGTRGNLPAPAVALCGSVVDAPWEGHSVKPDCFAALIERAFPSLPKIELNARRARPGWDAWGNEAPAATRADVEQRAQAHYRPSGAGGVRRCGSCAAHLVGNACSELAGPVDADCICNRYRPIAHVVTLTAPAASLPAEENDGLEIPAFLRRTADNRLPDDATAPEYAVTEAELTVWRALGAIDAGVMIGGPIIEQLTADGFVHDDDGRLLLTRIGSDRLSYLDRRIDAASSDDGGVRVAKAAPERAT